MASADGSILIRTNVDTTGIRTGTQQIQNGVGKINSSLVKLGAAMLAVFSVAKLIQFGKTAISLASDLQEVQNVVDVAFGDMSYKIEQFADTAIENFGLSELSAKSMASTFMAMANGMKQGLDVASDMAVEMTGRLADIMSFYNKSISEVETIGRAVYSGETEPLKQIGVIMTEAQLNTFALAEGYATLYKNMSSADKLLIRQLYFLDATNQSAGDFIRTQDSWANQTRILSERWKEFLTLIGGRLIQVLTPVIQVLNNMLSTAINLATAMANVFGWQVQQSNASAVTSGYVSDTADSEEDIANATKETNKALKKQLAFFDDINVLSSETASSGTGTSTGGTSTGGGGGGLIPMQSETETQLTALEKKMKSFFENLIKLIEPTTKAFKDLWNGGLALFGDFTWTALKDFYNEFLVPMAKWSFGSEKTGFARLLKIINEDLSNIQWDKLNKSLKDFWKAIEPYAEQFGEGLIDFFEEMGNFAVDIINLFPYVFDAITGALNSGDPEDARTWGKALGELAVGMIAVNTALKVSAGMSAFLTWIQGISASVGGLAGVTSFLSSVNPGMIGELGLTLERLTVGTILDTRTWGGLPKAIDDAIMKSLESISGAIGEFFNVTFSTLFNFDATEMIFTNALNNFENIKTAWAEQDWLGVGANLMLGVLNGILGAVTFIIEPIADVFTKIGQSMYDGVTNVFKGIKVFFINIINGIIGLFEGLVNEVIGGMNVMIEGINSLPGVDFNLISEAKFGRIALPSVATGNTVPQNSAFQQVLSNANNSLPSSMQQGLQNSSGSSNSNQPVILNMDGTEVARTILPSVLAELNRQGYNTTVLGAN